MDELFAFLNSIYPLSQKAIDYLTKNLKEIEVPRKNFVLKKGRVCYNIYFVKNGLLRCFYTKNDKEINSWFMKEQDVIFSVESFLNQIPSRESIQTVEDSHLYYISYPELQYLYNHCSEFNFIGRVVTEKYYQLSEQRLYSLRMQKAIDRYNFIFNHFPHIILRVPSKYIASYLGITEETLSRIRASRINNHA
ncbi:Crp/Fnr family transcriptional regulator [Ginsengibacter hankyongi]|uniref:Crp/Fnr family transcriptional regulator n=2 Tax=Ginsengibacter hankyongi TaxID=2607284 RepID=A0A5J5IFH0_9BACT|nr:Crp/Fnr family transcriptional regulator [Ginsengibacter hankyongi]